MCYTIVYDYGHRRNGMDGWRTNTEAAGDLGIEASTLRRLRERIGVGVKRGNTWWYSPEDMNRLRNRRRVPGPIPQRTTARGPRKEARGEQ